MVGAIRKSLRLQAKPGMRQMNLPVKAGMRGTEIAAIVELQSRLGCVNLVWPKN